MHTRNTYRGIDEYAARLIKHKARQMVGTAGYSFSDMPDLEQELVADLLQRLPRFNPTIAKMSTFVSRIVEHRIATILEARNASCRDWKRCQDSLNEPLSNNEGEFYEFMDLVRSPTIGLDDDGESIEDAYSFAIDFKKAMESLPEDLQEICQLLKGHSLTDVAQQLDMPRTTLYSKLRTIRNHFSAAGMQEYVTSRHPRKTSGMKPKNPRA